MSSDNMVIPEFTLPLIHQIALQERFSNYEIKSCPGSKDGDGLIGIVRRITIIGHRHNQSNEELSLILKTPPIDEPEHEKFFTNFVFEREIFAYTEFLPAIEKFQRKKGLSKNSGFFAYPKCFGTIANKAKQEYCVVLEDLKITRFRLRDHFTKPIDIDHVEMVVKELAKLHAVSFALHDQHPDCFERFQKLDEPLALELTIQSTIEFKDMAFDRAINCIDPTDVETIEKIRKLKENYTKEILECIPKYAVASVINHGDCWNNNIMYEYDANSEIPSGLCLIDWQFLRLGSPVLDLVFYIFISTHKLLRNHYFDYLLNIYYTTLTNTIESVGSDSKRLFPFEDFQNHLRKFGKFALLKAPILLPFITSSPEGFVKINKSHCDQNESGTNVENYVKRMNDIIKDTKILGYF